MGIWPVPPLDDESQDIKVKSLAALRIAHQCKLTLILLPCVVTFQKEASNDLEHAGEKLDMTFNMLVFE